MLRICAGVTLPGPPLASRTRAATAAAWGAAELVPEKFGLASGSLVASPPKSDVLAASIAATVGLRRISGAGSRLAFLSKKIVAGPGEVNVSGWFGLNTL